MSSSLPDEAISSSSASLPEDHRQYQELLQRVAIELQIPLQEFHDMQYKLMDILQPTGTSQVGLPVNEAIMEPVRVVWHTPASCTPTQKGLRIANYQVLLVQHDFTNYSKFLEFEDTLSVDRV